MNIYKTRLFPHIMGESLLGKTVTLTMKDLVGEMLPTGKGKEEEKLVLYFVETDKGLILNRTNAKTIASLYGAETDGWPGNRISIHPEQIKAFGAVHCTVRVDARRPNGNGKPKGQPVKPAPEAAVPAPADESTDQAPLFPDDEAAPGNGGGAYQE